MRTGYQLGPISKFRMIMANETRLDLPWDACTDFYTLFISDHSHVNDGDHVVGCYLNPFPSFGCGGGNMLLHKASWLQFSVVPVNVDLKESQMCSREGEKIRGEL